MLIFIFLLTVLTFSDIKVFPPTSAILIPVIASTGTVELFYDEAGDEEDVKACCTVLDELKTKPREGEIILEDSRRAGTLDSTEPRYWSITKHSNGRRVGTGSRDDEVRNELRTLRKSKGRERWRRSKKR
ncbi:hypothetical protein DL96DRAFT_1554378 [Flagelloscypha sp. PMI_526]|nr:hypothetical protein DL96DRAFT_1554378 [Flagelloscypha sp. PMI_526]